MRKVAMILGLLLASLCLNAQQVFLVKQGRGRAQQGMAIHGNWIFSCEDGGKVNLYDFRKRDGVPVTSFTLASAQKDNHANNAEFGIEKKAGASFPLLYISVGKVGCPIEWTCFVESVTRQGNTFTSELVQTILLVFGHQTDHPGRYQRFLREPVCGHEIPHPRPFRRERGAPPPERYPGAGHLPV